MFISIMATVMPMLEKMTEKKVKSPEAYMWTRQIMTMIKAMLMMTVFVINGTANDFFIACSFFFTCLIGNTYFTVNPYIDPGTKLFGKLPAMDRMEYKVFEIQIDAQKDTYSEQMGTGFRWVSFLTVVSFLFMICVSMLSPGLPVAVLKIEVEGSFDITSLSMTATIMILYNLFTWVELVQNIKQGP